MPEERLFIGGILDGRRIRCDILSDFRALGVEGEEIYRPVALTGSGIYVYVLHELLDGNKWMERLIQGYDSDSNRKDTQIKRAIYLIQNEWGYDKVRALGWLNDDAEWKGVEL